MFNFKLRFLKNKVAKKCLSLVLSLTMGLSNISVLNLSAVAAGSFEGGLGTPENPYQISTPEQLDRVRDNLSASYILTQDIDLTAYLAIGGLGYTKWGDSGWKPIGDYTNKFTGNFNGAGHTINGIWINRKAENNVGLFGCTTAAIENLGISISQDKSIKGKHDVGGLVGGQEWGNIANCYATGSVSGSGINVGGLVGGLGEGIITNCYATGSVTGSIESSFESGDNIGGLVGSSFSSVITNSFATGNVSGKSCVGGLVGKKYRGIVIEDNIIANCYATGEVYGEGYISSLVGYQAGGSITNSFATGKTVGGCFNSVGGLVGFLDYGDVTNCFFNTQTTGIRVNFGSDDSGDSTGGLTTAQMVDSTVLNGVMATFSEDWSKRTSDNAYAYYPELKVFADNGTAAQQEASKMSVRVARASIADITAPSVTAGHPLALTAPTITSPIEIITSQGWQLSANGTDTWSDFTGTALNINHNNYYLRYYATSDIGTVYSNIVQITVNKLDSTINTNPTASNIWQGSTLSASALTGGTANGISGSFTWTNPNTVVDATGNFSVTFTPDDSNYNITTVNITVTAIDKSALISLISSAKMAKSRAVVGDGNGQYLQQTVHTLENAIKAAETMANGIAPANQTTVNDAVSKLQSAIDIFKAQVIKNPKTDDKTSLPALMAIMFASLGALIITTRKRKSRNTELQCSR